MYNLYDHVINCAVLQIYDWFWSNQNRDTTYFAIFAHISHYWKITSLNFNNRVCGPMIFAIFAALLVKKQKLNPYSFLETVI